MAAWADLQESHDAVASAFFRPEYCLAAEQIRGGVEVAIMTQDGDPVVFLPLKETVEIVDRRSPAVFLIFRG